MARDLVKCAKCNNTFWIFGHNKTAAENKAEYLQGAGATCPDCQAKERAYFYAAQSEQSATLNSRRGLPALEGSPKQIAWAETIRATVAKNADEAIPYFDTIKNETVKAAVIEFYIKINKQLAIETSARAWISTRSETTEIKTVYRLIKVETTKE